MDGTDETMNLVGGYPRMAMLSNHLPIAAQLGPSDRVA
jgi:hypothetical protein